MNNFKKLAVAVITVCLVILGILIVMNIDNIKHHSNG